MLLLAGLYILSQNITQTLTQVHIHICSLLISRKAIACKEINIFLHPGTGNSSDKGLHLLSALQCYKRQLSHTGREASLL